MKEEKKRIEQPDLDAQRELDSIINADVSYVTVRGKKWKVSPLKNGTIRKMTHIILTEEAEDKVICKCAAAFRLNGVFMIALWHWLLWRYMYYVKEYRNGELLPFVSECKKKVGEVEYFLCTTLLIGMKDSAMAMTRQEVEHIQAAHTMEAHGLSQKSTTDSQNPSTTSGDS